MQSSVYLKHYRLPMEAMGSFPIPEGTFKATDLRSGAPVSLTLIPVATVPEEEREDFERRARSLAQFDHLHVARMVAFDRQGDVYAFVSESPNGETAEEWVAQYGRMPPEAVLRIGIQVVSAAGAAAFHQIFHRAINPSNLIIVPGQTAEGGWPLIKMINLVSDGFAPGRPGEVGDIQFGSPEALQGGKVDFRSQIYSLGTTMAYLLTGVFYSAEPKSLQTRRFARPLRKALLPMLRQNPAERPQDPVVIADSLRACLETVERRQLLARRFGIPFIAVQTRELPKSRARPSVAPRPVLAHIGESGLASAEPPPPVLEPLEPAETELFPSVFRTWSARAATAVAILLGLGLFAAALMPGRALALFQGKHEIKEIGVPQPAPVWEGKPLHMDRAQVATAETPTASVAPSPQQIPNESAPIASPPAQSLASNNPDTENSKSPHNAPAPTVAETENSEPASPARGPQSLWEKAGNQPLNERIATREAAPTPAEARDETDQSSEKAESSESTRSSASAESEGPRVKRTARTDTDARPHPGNSITKRRVVGTGHSTAHMAADGSVILRLPDGQIAVIPPPVDYVPKRYRTHPRRRVYTDRESVYQADPYYSPRD